jgi:aminoglycoside phosphotransferase (APT) family kinase protein
MKQKSGVDAAMAEVGQSTFETLRDLDIPFHELHFGKPHADVYVDSRSMNTQGDIERDLGWHVRPRQALNEFEALDGAIDARAFNLVRSAGKEQVIKSSSPDVLRGECHWYKSIPPALADVFPKPLDIVEGDISEEGSLSTITMSKVKGVTYSHLATSRLLMKAGVRRLVHTLHKIHTQPTSEPRVSCAELCSNYAGKIRKRVGKHKELYDSLAEQLGIDTRKMASQITNFLDEFEAQERTRHACYIHGDPVFSNVLRTDDDNVILIDMRGELGSRLTTQGDVHYDLSKVYQSLCGYDFMLLDQALDECSSEIFDGLRATFWDEVAKLYPEISHRDVRLHTAAHFFTIVPLHEVRERMLRYLRQSYSMLLVEGLL